ncbi:hypothetical protein [Dyadobacter psychrotolerans]|uniref:Cytochrome C n=1 Tax=Dyadobacter psychrotolerans TaxID=2541721 RepID=A0A4R5DG16_9BACT|nr:hypothetical protein [Dyadobacter psychrotolerans]TDE12739.1 hypothetical protein E0F88_20530 [Dyadobacter psychrotolerans]
MKFLLIILIGFSILASSFTERTDNGSIPSSFAAVSDTLKKDKETGLIVDKDLFMVKAQCTSCHSSKLIIANHFTRDGWKQKIRWMQANHNLWDLGETEKQVLDYLEKYYAPTQTVARREALKDIKWYKLEVK